MADRKQLIRQAINGVIDRHDRTKPLNHVNTEEWVEAIAAVLPLIEADMRERLAAEIKAEIGGEAYEDDANTRGWIGGMYYASQIVEGIVRGATADTDPAGGDEIPLSQRCVRTGCTNRIAASSVWYCHEHKETGQGPTGR